MNNPTCECNDRIATEIKSLSELNEIKAFFSEQLSEGVFTELVPQKPYYKYKSEKQWYADKWYKCTACGCLWEYVKPDFPASGFVRKFSDGNYIERGY